MSSVHGELVLLDSGLIASYWRTNNQPLVDLTPLKQNYTWTSTKISNNTLQHPFFRISCSGKIYIISLKIWQNRSCYKMHQFWKEFLYSQTSLIYFLDLHENSAVLESQSLLHPPSLASAWNVNDLVTWKNRQGIRENPSNGSCWRGVIFAAPRLHPRLTIPNLGIPNVATSDFALLASTHIFVNLRKTMGVKGLCWDTWWTQKKSQKIKTPPKSSRIDGRNIPCPE